MRTDAGNDQFADPVDQRIQTVSRYLESLRLDAAPLLGMRLLLYRSIDDGRVDGALFDQNFTDARRCRLIFLFIERMRKFAGRHRATSDQNFANFVDIAVQRFDLRQEFGDAALWRQDDNLRTVLNELENALDLGLAGCAVQ